MDVKQIMKIKISYTRWQSQSTLYILKAGSIFKQKYLYSYINNSWGISIKFNNQTLLCHFCSQFQQIGHMRNLCKEPHYTTRKLVTEPNEQWHSHKNLALGYIGPARELLGGNFKFNSLYIDHLQTLPPLMLCNDDLEPLGLNTADPQYMIKRQFCKKIYEKNMNLTINPFQMNHYFRNYKHNKVPKNKVKQPNHTHDQQLVFDSYFQSANLLKVQKQPSQHRYHLTMQNDINTYGCTQWFFFKVSNRQPVKATFFINNFYKRSSLYQKGMKILIFSKHKSVTENTGWVRGGQQIKYFPNCSSEKISSNLMKNFYTLKFSYYFEFPGDEVYFAYNYPYTYSKLNAFINEKVQQKPQKIRHRILTQTIAQNKVSILTISNFEIPTSEKKSIFISSRTHPGESVSSLMMEGVIEFLLEDNQVARKLRQKFIFKLIPMLNPDGVIHGNYRTNIAGFDLNRVWDDPDKTLCPQVYELKKYIIQYQKQCPMVMFCDLHGHSAKKSAFFYGCAHQTLKHKRRNYKQKNNENQAKLFPFIVSQTSSSFNFNFCDFSVQKNKAGTARVELWKLLKIPNIFTLEASFCSEQNSEYHFRVRDYKEIGYSFCMSLYEYFGEPEKRELKRESLNKIMDSFKSKSGLDQGSDSQSDNDLFDEKLRQKLSYNSSMQNPPRRSLIYQKDPKDEKNISINTIKKKIPQRTRQLRTEGSSSFIEQSPNKKVQFEDFPISKISIETECLKNKGVFIIKGDLRNKDSASNTMLQKVEHTYRGKSSLYRIKRRGQLFSMEPQKKPSLYKFDSFS